MTTMQKAILAEIKAHNESRDEFMQKFNKGIKFLSMGKDESTSRRAHGETYHIEWPNEDKGDFTAKRVDDVFISLTVRCKFSAKKYEDNVVIYQVVLYSDGSMGIYFDGTEYTD